MDRFTDGVWLVELASLIDGALMPQAISTALQIPSVGHSQAEVLAESLRNRQTLLVLDNCEQVIDACAELVGRLLQSCPGLRVLATSRERLDIAGEVVCRLTGLALPPDGASAEDVGRSEAGQLFLERARRLAPDLAVDDRRATALTRICQRLDGIPLAIELAATAARGLSLDDLAARLDDRFRLLRGAGRSAPARHQTLRATMDWSHQLLDDDESALFRRLAVFAGGFSLEAVEALHEPAALAPLFRLIDKSLVVVELRGRVQSYRMLETVREYAEEKLVDSGEVSALRDRHRDYFLALAEDGAAGLLGPQQVQWDLRLETEHDNLRAALAWCQADPQGAEKEERLAGALGRFWHDRGYVREGFAWLTHAAHRRPRAVSVGRGRALNWAAVIAQEGELSPSRQTALLEESVMVLRQTGSLNELSLALRHLAFLGWRASAEGAETRLLEEALASARAAGDPREIGWGLLCSSHGPLCRGDLVEARRFADEALAILRGLDPRSMLNVSLQLGRIALAQGDYARAETLFREMVHLAHEIGERFKLSDPWLGLAAAVHARGDFAGARACFRELVSELRIASCGHLLPRVLLGLAMLEANAGHDLQAARLLGAFDVADTSAMSWPLEGYYLGPDRTTLLARFEQEPYVAALAEGRRLTVDDALDDALADGEAESKLRRSAELLSPREQEVARLIVRGYTNRQIGHELVIAEPTAERHTANICA